MLGNPNDAEDLLQDAALLAFNSYNKLREKKYFKTWITRILINRCNRIRFTKKRFVMENVELLDVFTEDISDIEIELWNSVRKLDKKYKEVVVLKYINDMPISEIAQIIKCPIGTVKSRLHRALNILKIELDK